MRAIQCPNCDMPLPGFANFCSACGEAIRSPSASATPAFSNGSDGLNSSRLFIQQRDDEESIAIDDLSATNEKKSSHANRKKDFLRFILAVILFIMLPVPYYYSIVNLTAVNTSVNPGAEKNTHSDRAALGKGALGVTGQHVLSASPSFTFSAGGDIGGNAKTSVTLDLIASSGGSFHLLLGDLSYAEITPESAWCSYVQAHVGSSFPFELVSGNHEDGGEEAEGLIDNFVQCLPDRLSAVGTYGKEYYFDYPHSSPLARFLMISPGLTFTNGGSYNYSAGTAHYNWVASTIDSARAAGIKWIIVGMHKNCISMGRQSCEIGNDLFNLLVRKKVDLILQGHDHDYQRSKQLALNSKTCTAIQAETYNSNCVVNDGSKNSYTKGLGSVLVITGTMGEDLYAINPSDGDAGYFATWMGQNFRPANGITRFTLSANQLTVATNLKGSTTLDNFSDSFTIQKS